MQGLKRTETGDPDNSVGDRLEDIRILRTVQWASFGRMRLRKGDT